VLIDTVGTTHFCGASPSLSNSLQLKYNSTSGEGSIGTRSSGGSTFLSFQTTDSGTVADRLKILSGGNTQVLGSTLLVNPSSGGNASIEVTRTSGANVFIQSQSSAGVVGVATNNILQFKTNDTTRSTIRNSGQFNIGTNIAPTGRLTVDGSAMVGPANLDPDITLTETGDDVSLNNGGGCIWVNVPIQGTTTQNCTLTFTYAATSWKSWHLEYMFASTSGMTQGAIGGYNNGNVGNSNFKSVEGIPVTVAHSIGGTGNQHNIITFTFTASAGMGIHPMAAFKYTQGGGDGDPRADRVTVAYVEGS